MRVQALRQWCLTILLLGLSTSACKKQIILDLEGGGRSGVEHTFNAKGEKVGETERQGGRFIRGEYSISTAEGQRTRSVTAKPGDVVPMHSGEQIYLPGGLYAAEGNDATVEFSRKGQAILKGVRVIAGKQ